MFATLARRTAAATFVLVACAGLTLGGAASAQTRWKINNLVFTSFQGSGDGLHLSVSEDEGRTWKDQGKVFLTPQVGSKLMRDPHIMRGPDGIFRMVWTTGWRDTGIGYAASIDLVNWTEQKFLPLMEKVSGANNAWAPETFYDEATGQYVITWSSDVDGRFAATKSADRMNNRAYYVTTKDFVTFTEPKLLFDPGFDNIDTTIVRNGGRYIAVFKEGDKQQKQEWGALRWAIADKATGPYRLVAAPILSGQRAEGPTLTVSGGTTRLYVDYYGDGRYGAFETADWSKWTDISDRVSVANGQRHGTVFVAPDWMTKELATKAASATPATVAGAPPPALDGFTADPSIRVFRRHLLHLPDVRQTGVAHHRLLRLVVQEPGRLEQGGDDPRRGQRPEVGQDPGLGAGRDSP